MNANYLDDRSERINSTPIIYNPSAPLTDAEMEDFTTEATQILTAALSEIEQEGTQPC